MNKTTAMNALLVEFESNQRFRVLVWAVVVILLFYFALLLQDIQAELESDFLQVHKRVQEISSVSAQKSWLKKADERLIIVGRKVRNCLRQPFS